MRVYIDTSVIGGCLDREFREHSLELMGYFRSGRMTAVVSEITIGELELAPAAVQDVLLDIPAHALENVSMTAEAVALADDYINAGVIGSGSLADARHIATASVHRVDILVSWNFKHIVNVLRIRGYNSVNMRLGYPLLEIRSPAEVILGGS